MRVEDLVSHKWEASQSAIPADLGHHWNRHVPLSLIYPRIKAEELLEQKKNHNYIPSKYYVSI